MAKPQPTDLSEQRRTISREEIKARLHDRTLLIVDVLPKETHADEHIPGSLNLPLSEIEAKARLLIPDIAQEIAVYCAGPT